MRKFTFILVVSLLSLLPSKGSNQDWKQSALTEKLQELYQTGQWQKTLSYIDSLKTAGVRLDILAIEAECYAGLGDYHKAITIVENGINTTPIDRRHYLYQTLGNIYHIKKEYENSIENYKKAIELRPTYARPYICLAETYSLLGDTQKSIDYYLGAIDLFHENEFYSEVIEYASRILALNPKNIDAHKYLQYSLFSMQNYKDALSVGLSLYNLSQEDQQEVLDPQSILLTGMSAYHCKDYELSISFISSAIQNEDLSKDDAWIGISYLSAICYIEGDENSGKEFEKLANDSGRNASSLIKNLLNANK